MELERADKGLAFMLQYENIAWYDHGDPHSGPPDLSRQN